MEPNKLTRWPYLLAGALCMLFSGIIYAWSVLKAPLSAEFGWGGSQLALNYTLSLCFFCIGGVLASQISRRTSPRLSMILAGLLLCLGFFLCSRLSGQILMLYLSFGVLGGLGVGMTYNAVIATVGAWFPDKKGTCSGILMMSFGVSSLLLGKVADAMFSLPTLGWRKTYFILGASIGAIFVLSSLLIRPPAPGVVLPKPPVRQMTRENFEPRDFESREMLRRPTFWKFFVFCILTSAVGSTIISFARELALSLGAAAALATTLVGVLSVCNGLGRVLCGLIFDNLGRRNTMLLSNFLTILAPALVLLAVVSGSLPLGVVGLCCTGVCFGFSPTISSAFIGAFYGMEHFSTNYSIVNLMLIPSSFSATLATALLTGTGSYAAPLIMLIVFAVLALLLNLNIRRP